MSTQNETPDIQGVIPVNSDAKPYEPGYDWVAHGYDELDDDVKWEEHEGDYSIDGVLYCGHCQAPKQHVRDWHGKTYRFPIPCRCQKEALIRQEQKKKAALPWKRLCGTGNWVFPMKY